MSTNMYKNLTSPLSNLNTILANLSVGDSQHDFGFKNDQFKSIKNDYNSGLPAPFIDLYDEDLCLSSII